MAGRRHFTQCQSRVAGERRAAVDQLAKVEVEDNWVIILATQPGLFCFPRSWGILGLEVHTSASSQVLGTPTYKDLTSRILCPCDRWGFPAWTSPRPSASPKQPLTWVAKALGQVLPGKPHQPQGETTLEVRPS